MNLKLKSGTKMKDWPVEYRVALRLVTLGEQRVREANVNQVAKDVGISMQEAMQAINLLTTDKHVEVTAFSPATMSLEYRVEVETRKALIKDASSYHRNLLAAADRATQPKSTRILPPPIDPAVRESFLAAASPLADKLLVNEHAHATWQVAGCIARIGLKNVEALVEATLAANPPIEVGVLRTFFEHYVNKRDEQLNNTVD